MARYGVVIEIGPPSTTEIQTWKPPLQWNEVRALFRAPFRTQTFVVLAYGLAWGVVNWGFISFLPTFLRGAGFTAGTSSYLLFLPRSSPFQEPCWYHTYGMEQPSKPTPFAVASTPAPRSRDGAVGRQHRVAIVSMLALLTRPRAV
jgi:hypothetical protein